MREHPIASGKTVAYFSLALSLLCRSLVFVFAKQAALGTADTGIARILINPWYWAEIAALGAQTILWIRVLKSLDLNVAYPATALVYALNLGWSWYLFGETVSFVHILGCAIMIVGIVITTTSQSPASA